MMARSAVIFIGALFPLLALGQGGDQQVRTQADALFEEQRFAEAYPLYSQLVSLSPGDRQLNYRFGTCTLFGSEDKEAAIGHLKFATEDPSIAPQAWYWLGRAYHLNYRFKEAQQAYQRFLGTGDKKAITAWPVEALDKQCRNGEQLLSNLKEITVRNKVEVEDAEFFRFYDLSDIGGKIVVLPDELLTSIDKKKKERNLVYLPGKGGPIYFSSYGREGSTGRDLYRTELLLDGTFATPVKLAGYINTDQDENYPFMHPDGKTFYFSSKGHNSMGGYDVFRTTYDRGLDAFGRPENMDFAVNTPDDDIFYMVDGEQKEACFASGRNSHQGMLHVYRVATVQQPLVITVFKGTYASSFDQDDRRAHIMVEDAITRERVADVRTDMNGNYVLSVPRSGSFRYSVECGPTGRTHTGVVDVPKRDGPRAFRQELVLERSGDLEKLVIRNYFETPLEDDIIALALDEIKRRARLDISTSEPVVEVQPPVEAPKGDVMTRAGFTGDIDQAAAVKLAKEDAAELEKEAMDLDAESREAFGIAVEAAAEADRTASEAARSVQEANTADATQQNDLMVQAARMRQRSREANLRARAAYRTGKDLDATAMSKHQQAVVATKLATDVANAVGAQKDEVTLPLLVQLKERLDVKGSPEADPDAAEKARRAVTEHTKSVDRAMQAANAKRAEENELTDRIARLKREQDETRARSRKDELGREIATYEVQQGHLRKEAQDAFNKVAAMEKETAALRGQASLTNHLTRAADHGAGTDLNAAQVEQLGTRIAGTDERISALPIDERYEAQLALTPAEVEARTFDWDLASASNATGTERIATEAADRSTTGDAQQASARTTTIQGSSLGDRSTESTTVAQVPATSGSEEQQTNTAGERTADAGTAPSSTLRAEPPVESPADRTASVNDASSTVAGNEVGSERPSTEGSNDRFLLENQRAELTQLAEAERNKTRRDSLRTRIAEIDAQLAQAPSTEPAPAKVDPLHDPELTDTEGVDMTQPALSFTTTTKDEEIIEELFADFDTDRQRVGQLTDADERASSVNGLELMLADSVRAEMTRQVAILQLAPQRAEEVLPRVARLRELREAHIAEGERALAQRREELAALSPTRSMEQGSQLRNVTVTADGKDPINDRFIVVDRYAENVYASRIDHRSTARGVDDAVAFKEADVARMSSLSSEIDSLEDVLAAMPVGRERDKLRKSTDQLIDERLIIRTDMGQRSAFLTKEEWRTATDSMKVLEKATAQRALAPNEPLVLMAQGMQADAKRGMDQAAQMRKRADRIEDIVERDSLYREAYRTELEALREMDRAVTVQNYLAGDAHQRGETLTYEEVASKVLGIPLTAPEEPLLANATGTQEEEAPSTIAETSTTPEGAGTQAPDASATELAANTSNIGQEADAQLAERTTSSDTTPTEGGEGGQSMEQPSTNAVDGSTSAEPPVTSTTTTGGSSVPVAAKSTVDPAQLAAEQIQRAEQRLAPQDRVPARLYESFLGGESSVMGSAADGADPKLLDLRAKRAAQASAEAQQGSLQAADRAAAYMDSASTARKKQDRDRLEGLAVRERAISDSLHVASLQLAEEAQSADRVAAESEQALQFRDRLVKFYYLTGEEQALVMQNEDRSRYFQARTRALEQYAAADDAANAARSNREVGSVLEEQARAAERDAASGKVPAAEAAQRASLLDTRAAMLLDRADSLDNVAARLRGAAGINENQAGVMLQGMPAENSSDIMALEMRTRRTESLLAETRNQAGSTQAPASAQRTTEGGTTNASDVAQARNVDDGTSTTSDPVVPPTSIERGSEPRPISARMPEVLNADIFELRTPTERRETAIPLDAALPAGIVFKVQIGAFSKPVPQQTFSDMAPVMGETVGNGLVRYTAGLFTGFDHAAAAKERVRDRGYRDAFVVAYVDGKRVPLGEAMRAERALAATSQRAGSQEPSNVGANTGNISGTEVPVATIQRPAVVQPVSTEPDIATVLAAYPATAEEVIARFTPAANATSYYNVPGAAPARQVETVQGLFFTVQVGVYSKPVPLGRIFNITPLNSERTETAKVRYTTGIFLDMEKARVRKDETVGLGVKDAFVTAYLNGKRIPMREANALIEKFGPAILAKP